MIRISDEQEKQRKSEVMRRSYEMAGRIARIHPELILMRGERMQLTENKLTQHKSMTDNLGLQGSFNYERQDVAQYPNEW